MIKLYSKLHYSCPQLRSDALNEARELARLPCRHRFKACEIWWKTRLESEEKACVPGV